MGYKHHEDGMGWGGWVPTAQERAEDKLREELKTLRAVINAPTPREQELEVMLVKAIEIMQTCLTTMDGMDYERDKDVEAFCKYRAYASNKVSSTIAFIKQVLEKKS
jgi:hypothetical protein